MVIYVKKSFVLFCFTAILLNISDVYQPVLYLYLIKKYIYMYI